jgi:ketosteroid isomerase-like protein
MSYYDKAKDIYNMSAQGKLLDAFEKYYHRDVVMVEATGEERKGKEANRKFQQEFMGMIKDVHGTGVRAITSDEKAGTTMVESWMDVTMKDGKRNMMEEVAVQKWKDDQIIYERFYYNMGKA